MMDTTPVDRMPMRELEKLSGVNRMTINYYLKEGLLPPPSKTAKNMAYYDQRHLDRLALIQKLKLKNHLSLKRIKALLQDTDSAAETGLHLDIWNRILQPQETDELCKPFEKSELMEKSGLSEEDMQWLEDLKVLYHVPAEPGQLPLYASDSLMVVETVKMLLDLGIQKDEINSFVGVVTYLGEVEEKVYLRLKENSVSNAAFESEWKKLQVLSLSLIFLAHMRSNLASSY